MSTVLVRDAKLADLEAVRAITAQGFPGVSLFEGDELELALASAAGFWVAEEAGVRRGYLLAFDSGAEYNGYEFRWFQKHLSPFLYVDRVAIAPAARGRGIGKKLYARALEFARAQGLARLVCEVNVKPPNPDSMAFHTRLGFDAVGELDTPDGRRVALLARAVTMAGGVNNGS